MALLFSFPSWQHGAPHELLTGLLASLHAAASAQIGALAIGAQIMRREAGLGIRPSSASPGPVSWAALGECLRHREVLSTLNPHVIVTMATRTGKSFAHQGYLTRIPQARRHYAGRLPARPGSLSAAGRWLRRPSGWECPSAGTGGARATAAGLQHVIAPVRPARMENFARWTRDNGLHIDPWTCTHQRLGATILTPARPSMIITGTVAEWEQWTGMAFPKAASTHGCFKIVLGSALAVPGWGDVRFCPDLVSVRCT